jgi:fructosamine-3-kinase
MSLISYTNEPKLSPHEADGVFNERRGALHAQIENVLASLPRISGRNTTITFAHEGISSLIAILDFGNEKNVLKIPLTRNYSEGDVLFLKTWQGAGVRVPEIYEEGIVDGHSFCIMEYIDAPTLANAYTPQELLERGIYAEMGRTLRQMHTPTASNFGRVLNGEPEFATFKNWLEGPDIAGRIAYVQERELLSEKHGSVENMFETLQAHTVRSTYCHDDLATTNVFATKPLTVFDPNPRFNDGYIDLSRSVVRLASKGVSEDAFVDGYFNGETYDEQVLRAAVLLTTYMKLPYWHKTGRKEHIGEMSRYLIAKA